MVQHLLHISCLIVLSFILTACGPKPFAKWEAPNEEAPIVIHYYFVTQTYTEIETDINNLCADNIHIDRHWSSLKGLTPITQEAFKKEVERAMAQWSSIINVDFVPVESTCAADLLIGFSYVSDENHLDYIATVGLSFVENFIDKNGLLRIHKSFLGFNQNIRWLPTLEPHKEGKAFEVFILSLHELGHVLGLGHTIDHFGRSIMSPFADWALMSQELTNRDVEVIQKLYCSR